MYVESQAGATTNSFTRAEAIHSASGELAQGLAFDYRASGGTGRLGLVSITGHDACPKRSLNGRVAGNRQSVTQFFS